MELDIRLPLQRILQNLQQYHITLMPPWRRKADKPNTDFYEEL